MRRQVLCWALCALCALLTALSAARVRAATYITYQASVSNAPAGANDIDLVFSSTGGTVSNRTAVFPTPQNFAGSALNDVQATFAALNAGATYKVQFTALFASPEGGDWTQNGNVIKTIKAADVTLTPNVPEPSSLLTLGSFAAAFLAGIRRSRR